MKYRLGRFSTSCLSFFDHTLLLTDKKKIGGDCENESSFCKTQNLQNRWFPATKRCFFSAGVQKLERVKAAPVVKNGSMENYKAFILSREHQSTSESTFLIIN